MSANWKIWIITGIVQNGLFSSQDLKHYYNTTQDLHFFLISVFSSHSLALQQLKGGEGNGYHKPSLRESTFNEKNIWNYHARDNSTYPYLTDQVPCCVLKKKKEANQKKNG